MKENNNKSVIKKLFDRLQEESWQLELLVSGFTIFGLFYALKPVGDALAIAEYEQDILRNFYYILYAAIFILILNLIIHVVLRSLWIGALGLRYVSGEVDFKKLSNKAAAKKTCYMLHSFLFTRQIGCFHGTPYKRHQPLFAPSNMFEFV